MSKQLWKTGTGNYPNNVVNYLLNTSPMLYVNYPKDSRDVRLLWQNVTKTLPPFIRDVIELVFDERLTLKQVAVHVNVSPTTVRNIVRRLHSWLNKDGFAMEQMYNYAVEKGYVYTITQQDVEKACKLYMCTDDITEAQAVQFYMYLSSGLNIHEAQKHIGVRLGTLIRLYNKAVEIAMLRKTKEESKDENRTN